MSEKGDFIINGQAIRPGTQKIIDLPAGKLHTHDTMTMPVHVVNGKKPGPVMFVSAAIHGDEINGVEIIRRLLKMAIIRRLQGTLVTVPIVNIHGFINHSRYLPDRRDLNRSFPGNKKGSLAARMAHLFMTEIVSQCTHGIDLHTGAIHRTNLPQIRANLDDPETERLARAFDVPVMISSNIRDGSLRGSAAELGIPILLYEAGEALRFDEISIRAGVKGILNVMRELGMLPKRRSGSRRKKAEPVAAQSSSWIRAPESGIFRALTPLGAAVKKDALLGIVADPFGESEYQVTSPVSGIIIGKNKLPLVNEGDAIYHIAKYRSFNNIDTLVDEFQEEHSHVVSDDPDPDGPIV